MPTAEIHDSKGRYAGYAKFGSNGKYIGSFGGYGPKGSKNGASKLQNTILTAGARGKARNPLMF
jgi:hypothetical protein